VFGRMLKVKASLSLSPSVRIRSLLFEDLILTEAPN